MKHYLIFSVLTQLCFTQGVPPDCTPNEYFAYIIRICEGTCNDPFPDPCVREIKRGCFCKQGFVKTNVTGPCIPLTECKENLPPNCGPNEVLSTAENSTETKTSSENSTLAEQSDPKCICKKGYVKIVDGGACIPQSRCPEVCLPKEYYQNCGFMCNCTNPQPFCLRSPCLENCVCEDAYIELKETGWCIPPAHLPFIDID